MLPKVLADLDQPRVFQDKIPVTQNVSLYMDTPAMLAVSAGCVSSQNTETLKFCCCGQPHTGSGAVMHRDSCVD